MMVGKEQADLPVLLLYNLDRAWAPHEFETALQEACKLESGLRAVGHPVTAVPIYDPDLKTPLLPYAPEAHVVFNWCEELPGVPRSDALVAETLETLKFAYTGAPPDVLAFCQDKHFIKCLLDQYHLPTPRWRVYQTAAADDWNCFPAIVKPSREHCSFGVDTEAVVLTPVELRRRIA